MDRIPFSNDDENTIRSLAKWMQVVGTFYVVIFGILSLFLLLGITAALGGPPTAIIIALAALAAVILYLWQGLLNREGGEYFKKVADTNEADQDYVVMAFRKLKPIFMVEVIGLVLVALLTILQITETVSV